MGKCYCDYYANRTFEVKKGVYKDIKIIHTGKSSCNQYYLILNQVELIGRIFTDNSLTCKRKGTRSFLNAFLV